ncbi:MAG: hypothetical protein ACLQU3_00835 [Limisphaerales bacterium]
MKTKDILTITTVALGTATLTVAAFWAAPIEAGSDADTPPAKLAKPQLISHGVEMTLASAGGRVFKAGDQPEFELTALNTTNQLANVSVCVTMTASSPADALSRVIRLPKVLWQQEQVFTLQPNETKMLALCASTNLPVNSVISVSLREQDQKPAPLTPGIVALTFSTVVPTALPAVASTR